MRRRRSFILAIALEVLIPGRPLWPAQTVLAKLKASHPTSALIAQSEAVYSTYARRADCFAPLVAALPTDASIFGLVTFDDPETSLWWPLVLAAHRTRHSRRHPGKTHRQRHQNTFSPRVTAGRNRRCPIKGRDVKIRRHRSAQRFRIKLRPQYDAEKSGIFLK